MKNFLSFLTCISAFLVAGYTMDATAQPLTLTASQLEGPYYCPQPPHKPDFRVDAVGTNWVPLHIRGRVVNPQGLPIGGARVDMWHADQNGAYDESCVPPASPEATYRNRGYVVTDAEGRYDLWTVFPGLYPGRTRHLHAKIFGPATPDTANVTTQLYFPDPISWDGDFDGVPDVDGAPSLVTDGIFRNDHERYGNLVVSVLSDPRSGGDWHVALDFVIDQPSTIDINGDGSIDAADAGLMFAAWGNSATNAAENINRDAFVDAADAGVLFGSWTGDSAPRMVPEPNGALAVILLLAGKRAVARRSPS